MIRAADGCERGEPLPQRDQVEVIHRSFELDPTAGASEPVVPRIAAKYGITLP